MISFCSVSIFICSLSQSHWLFACMILRENNLILSPMQTVVLRVGMTCEGCVGAVKRVLGKMQGSLIDPLSIILYNTLFLSVFSLYQ